MVCSFIDQKSASTPTDKRDEENTMMTVPEKIKKFGLYLMMFYTYVGT